LRICIVTVTTHGIGGMQDHTRSLAKGLADVGHDVEVVTTRHPEGITGEIRDGARWHYVSAAQRHPHLPRRGPGWLPQSYEAFMRLHRERPIDVIHSESTSAIGLVRHSVHRHVPLVAKFHGNLLALGRAALARARNGDAHSRMREVKKLLWMVGEWSQHGHWHRFRPCVWMVPSAREFEDTRRSAFLKASLGYVVPNGIDVSLFRPGSRDEARAKRGLGDGPIFVTVGQLNLEKGVQHAIRALSLLEEQTVPPVLVVVGEGEHRPRLERLAHSLGIEQRVVFVGAQPHEAVAEYLSAADVFLFPTERAEAAPLVLPQAMASALPVIASDIGGITEVLERSGENGVLIRPGDTDALAAAMRRLLRDESIRRRLGEAAHRRVLDRYTIERMVEQTVEVYRVAIRRLGGASAHRRGSSGAGRTSPR
jgi:glycosyltransferase involved in cell wall biosynthesis